MTETTKLKKVQTVNTISQTVEVSTNQETKQVKKLTTLKGFTTSQVRKREKLSDTPAYCFLKTDQQEQDIPVIFRIKDGEQSPQDWIKPKIKKGSYLELKGYFAKSKEYPKGCLMRKSFTAYSYQLLTSQPTKEVLTENFVSINH